MLYACRGRDAWIGQLRWEVTGWCSIELLHWKQTGTTWYRATSAGTIDQEHRFSMHHPWWLPNIPSHAGRLVKYMFCMTSISLQFRCVSSRSGYPTIHGCCVGKGTMPEDIWTSVSRWVNIGTKVNKLFHHCNVLALTCNARLAK